MLIFLDIDGVMVPAKSWETPELSDDGFFVFSEQSVYVLAKLISKNTTIILTTSHRSNFSIQEWRNIFKRRNINIEKLDCLSFNNNILNRKQEIINWFNVNHINDDFIILDDDKSLNGLPFLLKEHWIKIKSFTGLTLGDLKNAQRKLHLISEDAESL